MAIANSTGSPASPIDTLFSEEEPAAPPDLGDLLDAATLTVSRLEEMLEAMQRLCKAVRPPSTENLQTRHFALLVEHLAARGIGLCGEASSDIQFLYDMKLNQAEARS